MSRTSCIPHPEGERLILIRKWQLEACQKDSCAAALLNLFEYWHNIKLEQRSQAKSHNEIAERHGENGNQITGLLQWHKSEQLEDALLNIFNKRRIQAAIELLENLKFISVHRNPNPRYSFDKTRHFLFHPNEVKSWLKNYLDPHSDRQLEVVDIEAETVLSQSIKGKNTESDNLHLSIDTNCTYGDNKSASSLTQIDPTVVANLPQQYTKNTIQDYVKKLPNEIQMNDVAFEQFEFPPFGAFWNAWVALTNKPINKKKSFEIFSALVFDEHSDLLKRMLAALDNQAKEKQLRQRLNLFVPQWPNPSSWLHEERWEDEVCLDEAFYIAERLRSHSGATQQKQIIKQQREDYLDDQYQSRLVRNQDETTLNIATRQDAILHFEEEFRNRKGQR